MAKLTVLLVVIFVYLQYSLWIGKNGLRDYQQVKQAVSQQVNENDQLKQRNDKLFAEIDDLKQGQQAIEARAREALDMIKPDETFYRLVPENNEETSSVAVANDPASTASHSSVKHE